MVCQYDPQHMYKHIPRIYRYDREQHNSILALKQLILDTQITTQYHIFRFISLHHHALIHQNQDCSSHTQGISSIFGYGRASFSYPETHTRRDTQTAKMKQHTPSTLFLSYQYMTKIQNDQMIDSTRVVCHL